MMATMLRAATAEDLMSDAIGAYFPPSFKNLLHALSKLTIVGMNALPLLQCLQRQWLSLFLYFQCTKIQTTSPVVLVGLSLFLFLDALQ
jgi:hypothetical protein